jgi:hypothetical protein
MKVINLNLRPKDGYWFQDADGVRHVGKSWTALIRQVIRYRKLKGAPEGDVKAEVNAQACERMPSYCGEKRGKMEKPRPPSTFKTLVIGWLSKTSREARADKLSYASEREAGERRVICANCPLRTDIKGVCSPCETAIGALRKVINKGRRAVWDGFHACSVLGNDLPTAILLIEPPVDNKNLPPACWRRQK